MSVLNTYGLPQFASSTIDQEMAREIQTLHDKYQFAHESVESIGASANQAQMEHEPSERFAPVDYRIRYAKFALEEVERALKAFDEFCEKHSIELFSVSNEGNYQGDLPNVDDTTIQQLRREKAFLDSYRDTLKVELDKATETADQLTAAGS